MSKEIPLTQGKVAIVSVEDYKFLMQFKWHFLQAGYAASDIKSKQEQRIYLYMHRAVMQQVLGTPIPEGYKIDHIDGDRLNNTRENLRLATNHQNAVNCRKKRANSQFRGITWNKKLGKWIAQVKCNYKNHILGYYINEEDAARAYDEQARKLFGEFARLNFPDE